MVELNEVRNSNNVRPTCIFFSKKRNTNVKLNKPDDQGCANSMACQSHYQHKHIYISSITDTEYPLKCRFHLIPLQCHNGRDGVSNHQPHHCLLNRLFRRRSKKTPKLRVTDLCAGNSPVTGEFPACTKGQLHGKCFHSMTSSCMNLIVDWQGIKQICSFHFCTTYKFNLAPLDNIVEQL